MGTTESTVSNGCSSVVPRLVRIYKCTIILLILTIIIFSIVVGEGGWLVGPGNGTLLGRGGECCLLSSLHKVSAIDVITFRLYCSVFVVCKLGAD